MYYLKSVRSRFASYHLKSGIFHFNRGEFKQAAEFFKRALKEDGLHRHEERVAKSLLTQTYLGWAEELSDQGDPSGALERIEAALGISPAYADMHHRRGLLLCSLDRSEEARDAFRRALQINEDYVEARIQVGYLLLDEGRTEDAAAEFERAFLQNIKRIERPFFDGKALVLEGEIEQGRELIRKAFDRRPHEAEQSFRTGIRALRHEQWLDAIDAFSKVIELDKGYADVHNFLGVAYYEAGRLDASEEAFRVSLQLNPRFLTARLNLGFLLLDAENPDGADEELRRVLDQEPDCTPALDCVKELQQTRRLSRKA